MELSEIDFDNHLYLILAYKMKMALLHIVPLWRQAVELVEGIRPITGNKQFVFLITVKRNP
ncbi:hypothetical protein F951_00665 [Acinetobacter soli CIP 110264]|nr:hypothetical protein F951_00665 [Acinetobacter soli CIP 110264]